MYKEFVDDIRKFNGIYKLPNHESPCLPTKDRIHNFMDILKEEVDEGADIIQLLEASEVGDEEKKLEALTALGDWLGDIIVYSASEARRAGLPLERILAVIMQSNFSKLGEDGLPIYDDRGKVMKGPNYWAPEAKIADLLEKVTEEKVSEMR